MNYLGLLVLGIFVGCVITLGIGKTNGEIDPGRFITVVIGAALSGAVLPFIDHLGGQALGDALFMYPIGLGYGMLCIYLEAASKNIRGGSKTLGWLHVIAFAITTILLLLLLFVPQFRELLPG